jgi:TolB-like protein
MGGRRDPSFLPPLQAAAADRDRAVRLQAVTALGRFGPSLDEPGRDEAWLGALQDPDAEVLRAAQAGLAGRLASGSPRGVESICRQLLDMAQRAPNWQSRKAAVELLERSSASAEQAESINAALVKVARLETHVEVRRAAVIALGSRDVRAASELLSRLRNQDPSEAVRLAAEAALRALGGPATQDVVAVLPFESRSAELRELSRGLQDYFTSALSAAKVATVVERSQIDSVLAELRFQDRMISDGQAIKVGGLLRADHVITGSLQMQGDEVICLSKRIEISTGKVEAAPPAVGARHDLNALKRDCAQRLVRTF